MSFVPSSDQASRAVERFLSARDASVNAASHQRLGKELSFTPSEASSDAALDSIPDIAGNGGVTESHLRFRTAHELCSAADTVPVQIAPYVFRGAITEFSGKPKQAGKTTFVTHLIAAVLDGRPFLEVPTLAGPVVFLSEQSPSSLRPALERADLGSRDDLHVLTPTDVFGLSWPQVMEGATRLAHSIEAVLLVVDGLGQWAGIRGDAENNAGSALEAMEPLQHAAGAGLAVVVVRHDRKGGGDVGEASRGSSAWAGAMDVLVQVAPLGGKGTQTRQLNAIGRFDGIPDRVVVTLRDGEYYLEEEIPPGAIDRAVEQLLAVAPRTPEAAMSTDAMIAAAGVGTTSGKKALNQLVDAGRLSRTGEGVRNSARLYYRSSID